MDKDYWVQRFLYPYACDTATMKLSEIRANCPPNISNQELGVKMKSGERFDLLETNKFQFPESLIDHKEAYRLDIVKPIIIARDQIREDLYKYIKLFPDKMIPHLDGEGQIIDNIHNYKRPNLNDEVVTTPKG